VAHDARRISRILEVSEVAMRGVYRAVLGIAFLASTSLATPASAQTTPYHLHTELSVISGAKQLKLTGPDVAATVLQSSNLKNQSANPSNYTIGRFETQSGVPNLAGFFPAQSVITFSIVMRKTASYGAFRPRATLFLNNYCCSDGVGVCTTAGPGDTPQPADLTQTFTRYALQCTTSSPIVVHSTDRFFVEIHVNVATAPGNHNIFCELDIEGTSSTDSYVSIPNLSPLPTITSLSTTTGSVNSLVTISGTNFGSTPGAVTFYNNKPSTDITSWTTASITARVPSGAATGIVSVTANGVNATCLGNCTFTVIGPPSLTSITPPTAHRTDSVTIAGANFANQQAGSTVTFNGTAASPTNWANSSITVPVPVNATSGNVVVMVSGQFSNPLGFSVIPPPTVTSATPAMAHRGDAVTIAGSDFGVTPGVITFNGVTATPTNWTNTSIVTTVPLTANTGPIVVAVSNQPSNDLPFTVIIPGTIAGTITRITGGTGIAGSTVHAVQIGVVKGTATTASNGSYSIANLDPAPYDVRVLATGFSSELRAAQNVTPATTLTLDVAMYVPGAVSGRVTQIDGVTPLPGAAVTIYSGPAQKGTTNTSGTGDYTIAGLHPGVYTVQAADAGYRTAEQGATVSEGATTTSNLSLPLAATGPVGYAYDELGRLVQVTDPSGESAIYRYDPVGNLTSIERPGATGVAISAFAPITGAVGTTVTIDGTGFSATPGANGVSFNGTPSTVTSATATHLVTTVPAGLPSATYTIGVTSPTGSAAKDGFVVTAASGAPTITSFTPSLAASGTALAVNGTNFETTLSNDNLRLNLSPAQVGSATTTAIQATVSPTATTGHVAVATPNGTATTATYLWIPPTGYLVSKVESTIPVTLGSDTPVGVSTAGNFALLAFDGLEGHRAAVKITGVTGDLFNQTWVSLFDPLGARMEFAPVVTSGFLDTVALRSTATYSLVFAPAGTATTGHLVVYDVPPDFLSPIGFGDANAVPVSTTVPGQNGRLTFVGAVGQRVSINQVGLSCFTSTTSLLAPDGTSLATGCGGSFIDRATLATAGTYAILVDPKDENYGSTTVTLYDVPADFSGTLPFDTPTVVTTTVPGQNGLVTFTGTANQRVALNQTGFNCFSSWTTIKRPGLNGQDGTILAQSCGGYFIDTQTLDVPGTNTYSISIDPTSTAFGSTTLTLYNVPADPIVATSVGGTAVLLPMESIGQNGTVTFTGTPGQQVTVHLTGNTVTTALFVNLYSTDLTTGVVTQLTQTAVLSPQSDLQPVTLPANASYKIVFNPDGMGTGHVTVSIATP
jgi:YD repeat-containing protein